MTIRLSSIFRVKDVGFEVVAGGLEWKVVSANTTIVPGTGYIVDTSGGSITLSLPVSLIENDTFGVKDLNGTFNDNNLVIDRNGYNIQGLTENFIGDVDNMSTTFTYSNITEGIVIVNGAW